jgi:predicted membrane-bound spermidine synthase
MKPLMTIHTLLHLVNSWATVLKKDIANILAFGSKRFDLISDDFDDPIRQLATRIYSRFEEMGYWDKLPQSSSNIDYDYIPY